MSHQPLSTILFRPVFVYSIVLLLAVGGVLAIVPLSWGVPVLELDPRMEVKLPPPTLEEVSNSLCKGRYTEVIQRSGQLLAKDARAPVYGMLGVAYAGLERFNKTAEAMKRAKAANEPNYQLFTHISQAAIHRVRGEYDAAIAVSRKAIKRDTKHPLAYTTVGFGLLW